MSFIKLRIAHQELFTGKRGSASVGYASIVQKMNTDWPKLPPVSKKWAHLTAKYRLMKTPPTGSSTEEGARTPTTWPYLTILDSFFSERHSINPPFLIDSSLPKSSPPKSIASPSCSYSPTHSPVYVTPSLSTSTYLPQSPPHRPVPSSPLPIPMVAQPGPKCLQGTRKRARAEDPLFKRTGRKGSKEHRSPAISSGETSWQ